MPETHACNMRPEQGDVPIATLNLDPIDFGFLTATRYFCLSFSEPQHHAWVTIFLASNNLFPDPGSAEALRRALAVVHEMRLTRRSMFRFSNPRCQVCSGIVTHDERHLVQLIQATRRGKRSQAAPSALLLTEGNDTDRVLAAADDFALGFKVSDVPECEALHQATHG